MIDANEQKRELIEKVVGYQELVRTAEFRFENIPVTVKLEVFNTFAEHGPGCFYYVRQSHFIATPVQAGPYIPSGPFFANPEVGIQTVIDWMLAFYNEAIRKGHKPSESWLMGRTA